MAGLSFDDIPAPVPGTKRKGVTFDDVPAAVPPPGGGVSSASPDDVGFWGTVGDMAASVPTGIVKGIAETIMSPVTMARMSKESEDSAKGLWETQHPGEELPWYRKPLTEVLGLGEDPLKSEAVFGGQDVARQTMDENLYKPKTAWGRGTEELSSFLAPAAWPSRITRMA